MVNCTNSGQSLEIITIQEIVKFIFWLEKFLKSFLLKTGAFSMG